MVTEDQFRRLNQLPPEARAAAMSAFSESAKGDPPPEVQRQLMEKAIALAEADQTAAEHRRNADLELATPPGALVIAGYQARPMSAGVIQVLDRIKHPLIVGGDVTIGDIVALLYCLCWPSIPEIIAHAKSGTLNDAACEWAFDLDIGAIQDAYQTIEESFASLGTATEKKTMRTAASPPTTTS